MSIASRSPKASKAKAKTKTSGGMEFASTFCLDGKPLESLPLGQREAKIKDAEGKVIFVQKVIAPETWSDSAVTITGSKYFHGPLASPDRECSIPKLVDRVATTISLWGLEGDYFASGEDAQRFDADLKWLLLNQYGSFNSPVWFNVGVGQYLKVKGAANNWRWDATKGEAIPCEDAYRWPQGSACFIQSVKDDMTDIMKLATSEAMLFKFGSGTGTDLSTLRSSREFLSSGGRPSGPVSFMRVYDAVASVIKSGGAVRRAAKMQTLNARHPDIQDFIECKPSEDRKAKALIAAGYSAGMTGATAEAYSSVTFQNANLSVRASDNFMRSATASDPGGQRWETVAVTSGDAIETLNASDLLDAVAQGTWECGDPGMQFEDTISAWHTVPNTAPINSSNPCAEYMHIDDSACNLASLNLMKFRRENGSFDDKRFRAACRVFITAQEILVGNASYPTKQICENSINFRPLGLGYANLGGLIMANGLAYDSPQARELAACITAIMTAQAYVTSAEHARHLGPFNGFAANREPMLDVIDMHHSATWEIRGEKYPELKSIARVLWARALDSGTKHGYRNSQASVLAPTGTIGFMMDCDTTGVEPAIALVSYKSLAGGGILKNVNRLVPIALASLGYDDPTIKGVVSHIDATDGIEGAPLLFSDHLPVFDCAFPARPEGRSISWKGHLEMMADCQPFLSGAISKTVNMPESATVAEIREAYVDAWKLGIKAVAIYRDGSKGAQPVTTSDPSKAIASAVSAISPRRERLPDTRRSITHKFSIGGHEGYITVGLFPDGRPGEVFVTMSKVGSTIAGLMNTIATQASISLQYGVPVSTLAEKFSNDKFEPAGITSNREIPFASSPVDYLFRWMGLTFESPVASDPFPEARPIVARDAPAVIAYHGSLCPACGNPMEKGGRCERCPNCGTTGGCG